MMHGHNSLKLVNAYVIISQNGTVSQKTRVFKTKFTLQILIYTPTQHVTWNHLVVPAIKFIEDYTRTPSYSHFMHFTLMDRPPPPPST